MCLVDLPLFIIVGWLPIPTFQKGNGRLQVLHTLTDIIKAMIWSTYTLE